MSATIRLVLLVSVFLMAGCGQSESSKAQGEMAPVGADADEHGCRASAGYRWCEATARCERPWELAEEKGFDNNLDAFAEFCSSANTDP